MARYSNQRKKSSTAILISIIAILSIMLVGLSFAYFTDHKELSNTLSFGKLVVSVNGTAGTTSTKVLIFGNGSSVNNGLLDVGDTIDFKGTVGLEDNSISAYLRMKLDSFKYYTNSSKTTEATTKPSSSDKNAFITNFLTAVANSTKASSGTQQDWTYINNYLYYGKMIQEGSSNIYTFNSNIEITEDLVPTSFWGLTIQFDIVIQAIQASGAVNSSNVKISDSVTATTTPTASTASTVASATMWASAFPEGQSLEGILYVQVIDNTQTVMVAGGENCPSEYTIPSYVKMDGTYSNGCPAWFSSDDDFADSRDDASVYKVVQVSAFRYWDESSKKFVTSVSGDGLDTMISFGSTISKITIPSTVTNITRRAFDGVCSLKTIIFNEGLLNIEFYAFNSNIGGVSYDGLLTSVTFPMSLSYISVGAFSYFKSLTSATFLSGTGTWLTADGDYVNGIGSDSLNASYLNSGTYKYRKN